MTEEGQGVIVLKDNKKEKTNKEENKNGFKPKVDISNYNQEVLDSKGNLKTSTSKNEQLEFNEKDIYKLSSEAIEKLGISPCQICQSNNYSIFIPETVYNIPNQEEKPQDQTIENENQIQKNTEGDYIKPVKNQNIFLPIIICNQNHQTCLICKQSPHIDTLCNEKNIDYNNAIVKLNFIKENFPEKSNLIESMKQSLFAPYQKESCCSCKCCCKCFGISLLFFLWTLVSIFLFVLGIIVFALTIAFRVLSCVCHCCYHICCTVRVHTEYEGDQEVQVTTIYKGKQEENEISAKNTDENICLCGTYGGACVLYAIYCGYEKICDLC